MAFDSFTGHLMLFGDGHITQIDPANPTVFVSDRAVGGVQFDQGTVDGNGHMFVADNNGNLFFMDYSASGLVANAGNFVALQFLDTCLDDVAPLSGLGEPPGPGLDIKPGSCPNSYNRNSNGVLPVALVGTDTFDVADVDVTTLLLSRADGMAGSVAPLDGPPGPGLEFEDVATPFDVELCDCHEETGDGTTDLSMKFKTQDVVSALDLDEFDPGALVELCVSGETLDDEADLISQTPEDPQDLSHHLGDRMQASAGYAPAGKGDVEGEAWSSKWAGRPRRPRRRDGVGAIGGFCGRRSQPVAKGTHRDSDGLAEAFLRETGVLIVQARPRADEQRADGGLALGDVSQHAGGDVEERV